MKNTKLSQIVRRTLEQSKRPVSVPELQLILAEEGVKPNKTSLYRMLEKMKQEGMLEEVLLDSRTRFYEVKTDHHHHFTCNDCSQVTCFADDDLERKIHELADWFEAKGMKISSHQFSLSGVCENCV